MSKGLRERLQQTLLVASALLCAAAAGEPAGADSSEAGKPRSSCGEPPAVTGAPHWPLRQEIAAMFAEAATPGAAVIALRNDRDEPLFEMYYGCRSLLPGEPGAVGKDTSFLLASLSKTLTATTVLHLADMVSKLRPDQLDLKDSIRECLGPSEEPGRPLIHKFLNCPIERFLPKHFKIDFPCPNDPLKSCPRTEKIRFVDLLEHTSGIIDDYDGPLNCVYNLDADSPMTLTQIVERYLNRKISKEHPNELVCVNVSDVGWSTANYKKGLYNPTNFGPFGVFKYSNSGYSLLGYMVERVLETVCPKLPPRGKRYAAWRDECGGAHHMTKGGSSYPMWKYSHHAVFNKLGMSGDGELAGRWLWSKMEDHAVCAALDGYEPFPEPIPSSECRIARPAGNLPYYNFPGYPNGGFRATARALSHFLRMLMNDGSFRGPDGKIEILTPETAQGIWNFTTRPWPWQTLTSRGFTFTGIGFALQAIEIPTDPTALLVGHTGGEMGVATAMFWLPAPIMDRRGHLRNGEKSLGVLVITNGNELSSEIMVNVFRYFRKKSIP